MGARRYECNLTLRVIPLPVEHEIAWRLSWTILFELVKKDIEDGCGSDDNDQRFDDGGRTLVSMGDAI
jgi:hypothetical protein